MLFDVFRNRNEDGRRKRKVEQTVDIASRIRTFDPLEMFGQVDERLRVIVTTSDISRKLFEVFEVGCGSSIIVRDLDVGSDAFEILFGVHFRAGVADDVDVSGEIANAIETKQGGIRLQCI